MLFIATPLVAFVFILLCISPRIPPSHDESPSLYSNTPLVKKYIDDGHGEGGRKLRDFRFCFREILTEDRLVHTTIMARSGFRFGQSSSTRTQDRPRSRQPGARFGDSEQADAKKLQNTSDRSSDVAQCRY